MGLRRCVAVAVLSLTSSSAAVADFIVFSDKTAFLASSGAVDASGDLPSTEFIGDFGGSPPGPITTVGSMGFQAVRYRFTDQSSRLPGNEFAVSFGADGDANEDLNLIVSQPAYSLGFDFVEPEHDPNVNAPFVDSTFTVTLKSEAVSLFSFTFNAPNDTAAFVGVWGDTPFDRVEIRETTGGDENEFFGRVYAGFATSAVPEPSTVILIAIVLISFAVFRACRPSLTP